MKQIFPFLIGLFAMFNIANAQYTVTINVTDSNGGSPLENVQVVLDGNFFATTDGAGNAVFTDFADGEYFYSTSFACYNENGSSVIVDGEDVQTSIVLEASTTNSVFFFVGSPFTIPGASVVVTGDDFFQEIITGAPFGDVIENVPFGEYSYSISAPCYELVTGTFTVDCTDGNGIVVSAEPVASTTNSVFFFVGSPFTIPGASVVVTGDDFFQEIITGAPFGDVIENVPFGEYSYSISAPCYESVTGTFTVDCTDGNGIVVSAEPVASTTNSVFFFVGSPFTIPGASVVVTGDDFFQEIITGAPFGDVIENVPFGEYSYSISAPCYELVTGTFTVDCTDGNGIVVSAEPVASTTNSVFFFVGSPFTIPGATVTVSGENFSQEIITGAPFGDVIENVPFGEYSYTIVADCYEAVSGTFVVECINGEGIVVSEEPIEIVIDNSTTQNGATIEAVETAAAFTYQWVDCDNDNNPISGETNSSFTATEIGSYAVVITNGTCSVISECVNITSVGINKINSENNLNVFPNPFSSAMNIELPVFEEATSIDVYSISGQLVFSQKSSSSNLVQVDLSNLNSGSYIVVLRNSQGIYRAPIQKN